MLRRPPTAIELKLDDINEFEEMRQQLRKDQASKGLFGDIPSRPAGPKSKQEVHSRIGYIPERPERGNRNNSLQGPLF